MHSWQNNEYSTEKNETKKIRWEVTNNMYMTHNKLRTGTSNRRHVYTRQI